MANFFDDNINYADVENRGFPEYTEKMAIVRVLTSIQSTVTHFSTGATQERL